MKQLILPLIILSSLIGCTKSLGSKDNYICTDKNGNTFLAEDYTKGEIKKVEEALNCTCIKQ